MDFGDYVIYIERVGHNANIHFGAVRQAKVDIASLIELREELLQDYGMVFGWVNSRNRGLKRICEAVGLLYYGVRMFHGESRNKLITWQLHSISRNA